MKVDLKVVLMEIWLVVRMADSGVEQMVAEKAASMAGKLAVLMAESMAPMPAGSMVAQLAV